MRWKILALFFSICMTFTVQAEDDITYSDSVLRKVIKAYGLYPYKEKDFEYNAKIELGKNLFFDPMLSGPQNIACAGCHLRSKGSVDGLSMPVGIGAHGVGSQRLTEESAFIVPRNVLPLFNIGVPEQTTFFWDGRVQLSGENLYESPLGSRLPHGFDSLLSVATVFPIVEPDEMLGRSKEREAENDIMYHNDLVSSNVDADNFQDRTLDVFQNIVDRLIGSGSKEINNDYQIKYQDLFKKAYPNDDQYDITHIGNSLSEYIDYAFRTKASDFDKYVAGDNDALTSRQKSGAMVFYGKGRCAVCHSGQYFTDFQFHSLSIPQLGVGKNGPFLDYGRANATGISKDRFLFRTPSLRNVSKTGPWGHNGAFISLKEAIVHHFNPIPLLYMAQKENPGEARVSSLLLQNRSPILAEIFPVNERDVNNLIYFLEALSSSYQVKDNVAIPKQVPSMKNNFIEEEN